MIKCTCGKKFEIYLLPIYCSCGEIITEGVSTYDPNYVPEPKGPSFLKKVVNLTKATAHHVLTGMKGCTQEQIDYRLAICKACELFIKKDESVGVCGHEKCGCNLKNEQVFLNKLAWADQQCPLGKWTKISPEGENGV